MHDVRFSCREDRTDSVDEFEHGPFWASASAAHTFPAFTASKSSKTFSTSWTTAMLSGDQIPPRQRVLSTSP